jgi:hypothetical protein
MIDLLARTGIYGTTETNVNRKIIPTNKICDVLLYPEEIVAFSVAVRPHLTRWLTLGGNAEHPGETTARASN